MTRLKNFGMLVVLSVEICVNYYSYFYYKNFGILDME
jgi:hypothetical protein